MQCYQDWASARQRTLEKPAGLSVPPSKKREITPLWLFLCRSSRLRSLLLRNSMVGGRRCAPEVVLGGRDGKMAARAALGSMCRRLWQGSRSFSISSSKSSTARNGGFLLTSMKWVQFSNLHVDIPKDLTKPTITISDEPDTLYKRLSVLVKGHDKAVLDSYEYFAVLAAKELGISIKVHEPPRKIERFTLLKSVHIFKKHRVQYEMRTLYRCLELEHLTGSTADVYLEYIQRNLPEGIAMEVIKTKLERLPEHIKEPIWETVPEEKVESKS
ncbi:28S ribosomal protein S10, mitochondrial isoform X2 [Hyaena hyaena]|uniref:28S ribosomal protein S10, mitochondrial isoform X2 n=1 Tax=Hyaena hyaena TaxID=95912 RepID=UPI001920CDD5|nr:28S ribosomal protein S10, mitochondrial isoform X2 [Hyaena hyaena]